MQLIHLIPGEIFQRIVLEFCDGKSVSTLMLVMLGSKSNTPQSDAIHAGEHTSSLADIAKRLIPLLSKEKLWGIALMIEHLDQEYLAGATRWIRSIANFGQVDSGGESFKQWSMRKQIRAFSENMAVYDFLVISLSEYSNVALGQLEWPVLCFRLLVQEESSLGRSANNDVNVVITTPMQRPCHIPGSSSIMTSRSPLRKFRCEPYNIVPVPPWGIVRPMEGQDQAKIARIAKSLESSNQVAVPVSYYMSYTDILDVRILSLKQARDLQSGLRWRPQTSWILTENGSETVDAGNGSLMCCWHDDDLDLFEDDREYVGYILNILDAIRRFQER